MMNFWKSTVSELKNMKNEDKDHIFIHGKGGSRSNLMFLHCWVKSVSIFGCQQLKLTSGHLKVNLNFTGNGFHAKLFNQVI